MKFPVFLVMVLGAWLNVGYGAEKSSESVIELNFFWSHRCSHCLEAKPFIEELDARYDWLSVKSYDLMNNQENVQRYITMAKALNDPANAIPGFIFCDRIRVGFDSPARMGKELERELIECHESNAGQAASTQLALPLLGTIDYQAYSLPFMTVFIAALDAFNPCAFFVLLFLLSLIAHGHSRQRIAIIGGIFVVFSGGMYFIFMAAWLNLFLMTQQLELITTVAGIIAVLIAGINIKDYFFFKQGLSLSIPESAKPMLFQRMRSILQAGNWPAMVGATVVLAIAANSYELLCTAGLPMIYTRILTLHALSTPSYYAYLALYNMVYVIPLLVIVVIYTLTLGSRKLTEQQGRLLKLLSGLMMLNLGIMLLVAPEWLNNMLASLTVLGSALLITCLAYLLERMKTGKLNTD
ncbi:MAG: hypothetical protein Q7U98_12725 [Methylicorpusculum sp.]|uniref:hypothetical protein n=1 Tax=Methylicorpusculum sp. TaxID=2713644 RepID=UPI00271CDDD9|nr:hypothetical protein [Methylicorpusculum sp.]MDO8940014.1 hypothetical protein [Methylicorpusculum sp.]MDP2203142.1 hypothetical protein [Methylicorpusculum sp.]